MGPTHSFWNVLGPAQAPRFGTGSRQSRGGIDPARPAPVEDEHQARVAELVLILGEANRVASRSRQIFSHLREASGLSGIETLTLMAIAHAAKPPTVPQVGRQVGHPRQVIQRAVRVLEEAGLVQPQPNPGHKRAALLIATAKGQKLGRDIDAQAAEVIADLSAGLDLGRTELAALGEGLIALRERMEQLAAEQG